MITSTRRAAALAVSALALASLAVSSVAVAAEKEPPSIEVMPRLPDGYRLLDRIVAFVNEEIVTLHEFEQAVVVNRSLGAAGGSSGSTAETGLRDEALDALVDSILVLDAAKTLQLTVSDREVDAYITRAKAQAKWSDEEFVENIGKLGFTVEQYRQMTRREMLKARIVSIKVGSRVNVGENEVKRVLESEYYGGEFEDEVRASLILLRLSPTATKEEVADAERLAEQLRRLAEAAPERFGDLARKYSEHDPTRLAGGDVGWFARGTFADEALDEAAFSLEKGEVSDVLRSDLGLEVLMVTDRRKKPVDDREVLRDRVYERLVQQEKIKVYLQWVKELRDQAYVEKRL